MLFRPFRPSSVRFLLLSVVGASTILVLSLGWVNPTVDDSSKEPYFSSSHQYPLLVNAAYAQNLSAADIAQMIYEALPSLPLENDYVNQATGDVDANNTLMSRFIRYHLYVVRRSPNYRLDWKISLADYLGINEWMRDEQYPGSDVLTTNPKDGDIAAIQQLNRAERDALVQELVDTFETVGNRLPTYGSGY